MLIYNVAGVPLYSGGCRLIDLMHEPIPHIVYYLKGKVIYIPPDKFLFGGPRCPSDCERMVPNAWTGRS